MIQNLHGWQRAADRATEDELFGCGTKRISSVYNIRLIHTRPLRMNTFIELFWSETLQGREGKNTPQCGPNMGRRSVNDCYSLYYEAHVHYMLSYGVVK